MRKILLILFVLLSNIAFAQYWAKSYNDASGNSMCRSAVQSRDGSYFFASNPEMGLYGQISKLDTLGNVIWSMNEGGVAMTATPDSCVVVLTPKRDSILYLKYNTNGGLVWRKSFNHYISKITSISNGNFVACGTDVAGCGLIVKLNSLADTIWTYKSDFKSEYSVFTSVAETIDNGFIAILYINTPKFEDRYYEIVKLDSNGKLQWSKVLTCKVNSNITQANDGSFFLTCNNEGVHKLDQNANIVWTYGLNQYQKLTSIKATSNNGCIAVGRVLVALENENFLVVKLDSHGQKEWVKYYYAGSYNDFLESVEVMSDGGYLYCGSIDFARSNYPVLSYIIRTNKDGNLSNSVGIDLNSLNTKTRIFPNPANDVFNILNAESVISVNVINVLGQVVNSVQFYEQNHTVDITNLKAGIYQVLIRYKSGEESVLKLVKE